MHLVSGWQYNTGTDSICTEAQIRVSLLTMKCMFSSWSTHKLAVATMPLHYGENNGVKLCTNFVDLTVLLFYLSKHSFNHTFSNTIPAISETNN